MSKIEILVVAICIGAPLMHFFLFRSAWACPKCGYPWWIKRGGRCLKCKWRKL